MCGMCTSAITHDVSATAADARKSAADENALTLKPSDSIRPSTASRTDSSSSTIEISAFELVDTCRLAGWVPVENVTSPRFDRAELEGADQPHRTRCHAPGLSPASRRNVRVKWAWSAKP